MKKYISVKAVCPYYEHESRQMIDCTGPFRDTVTHITFASASNAYEYKKNYCRADFKKCPIYKMLNKE